MPNFREEKCNKCETLLGDKRYRLNLTFRNPEKKYVGSRLPMIDTKSFVYCKKCFVKVGKELLKIV